jgi:hypothetical protein
MSKEIVLWFQQELGMTGTGSRTHAVASPTAAQKVKSRSARRRHAVLRPEKGTAHITRIIQTVPHWEQFLELSFSILYVSYDLKKCSPSLLAIPS